MKQERVRRAYSRKEREREEFQAAQAAAEVSKERNPDVDREVLEVTEELLEEIDNLLASEDAIDAVAYQQKGGE